MAVKHAYNTNKYTLEGITSQGVKVKAEFSVTGVEAHLRNYYRVIEFKELLVELWPKEEKHATVVLAITDGKPAYNSDLYYRLIKDDRDPKNGYIRQGPPVPSNRPTAITGDILPKTPLVQMPKLDKPVTPYAFFDKGDPKWAA